MHPPAPAYCKTRIHRDKTVQKIFSRKSSKMGGGGLNRLKEGGAPPPPTDCKTRIQSEKTGRTFLPRQNSKILNVFNRLKCSPGSLRVL